MHSMNRALVAVVLLVASSAAALVAAQIRYLPDAPGTWKPWRFEAFANNRRLSAATAAEVKALEAQLLALNAILRKAPGFDAPQGFSVETVGSLDPESRGPGQPAAATLPLPSMLNFGAYAVHTFGQGAAARQQDTGETAQILFFVNQLALELLFEGGGVPEFGDLETDVTLLATSQPDAFGMPRHGNALVLKKNPAPLSSAVSLEESLQLFSKAVAARLTTARAADAHVQKQYDDARDPVKRAQRLAEFKKLAPMVKDPTYLEKMVKADQEIEAGLAKMAGPTSPTRKNVVAVEGELAAAKAALAALPAADRAAASCYAARNPIGPARFSREPAPGCLPIVRPNWRLFNSALPRSAPQVLAIGHFERCLDQEQSADNQGGCTANRKLLEGLDKQAVLAWLQ